MTAVATILRPWQFCVNAIIKPSPTAGVWPPQYLADSTGRVTMLYLKNALKGAGVWTDLLGNATTSTGNWDVVSSCDGAGNFGNNNGVDWWADVTDIVPGSGVNPKSWIVLSQPGISPNFELCISMDTTVSYTCSVVFSPNQRFGVVGGGVNGTGTARPTALDEVSLVSGAAYGAVGYPTPQRVHVLKSADGAATRILFTRGGFTGGMWCLEAPIGITEGWLNPAIGVILASSSQNISSSSVEQTPLLTTANFKGLSKYPGGAVFTATLSTSSGVGYSYDTEYVPNDIDGAPMFYPASLLIPQAATNVGMRATYGTMADLYYPPKCAPDGMTYPADGSRQWVQVGRLVMPWNKSPNIWY